MARMLALYLPQYHPTPENDEWWGKGFTEWFNVVKAKPLFRGHKQPHMPADLGFYDLRLPQTREDQARLARQAGIEGFCYWHYWFAPGKRLLEFPFNEVLKSGRPDFPFCLAWANHSWYKKSWNPHSKGKDVLLIEQTYGGENDYKRHFEEMLPAFKDKRYLKVNNKPIFIIFDSANENIPEFIRVWRNLAKANGIEDFYFIGKDADSRNKKLLFSYGFDAIYNDDTYNIHHHLPKIVKMMMYLKRRFLKRPTAFKYKDAIHYMINDDCQNRGVVPVIVPNWDHSPRSKGNAIILTDNTPELFQKVAEEAIKVVHNKPKEEQLILIKSWNEWGEGNYMEPDQEFGHGNLIALKKALEKFDK